MENLNSARAVAEAAERKEREREVQRKEREFDKNVSLAVLNELKSQKIQQKNACGFNYFSGSDDSFIDSCYNKII